MATIICRKTKKEKKRYRAMIRKRGHVLVQTFSNKRDAADWARDKETDIQRGKSPNLEAQRRTLAQLIDRYVSEVLSEAPEHRQKKRRDHLAWWRGMLGQRFVGSLTPQVLDEYRTKLRSGESPKGRKRTRKRSPATCNRYLSSLSHALKIAVTEWGWLEANPVRKLPQLKEPRSIVRFLSDDERDRLFKACQKSTEPRLYPLVLFAITTGARQGEMLGLRWSDVDIERQVAVFHKTENEDRRAVPLSPLVLEQLIGLGQVRRLDTDLVFANRKESATWPRSAWERALSEAKIENFRPHDLRHSAASYLAMNGASPIEIAAVLSHKTLAVVQRYSHLSEPHILAVVQSMNRRYLRGTSQ